MTISGSSCPHRNIITIAVFYALPVIQLVVTYQTVSAALKPTTRAVTLCGEIFAGAHRGRYNLELVQKLISHLGSNWTLSMFYLRLTFKSNSQLFYHKGIWDHLYYFVYQSCIHSIIVSISCVYYLAV